MEAGILNCCIPQESFLGPFLFLVMLTIFTNHHQKVVLTFMVMIRVFSIKTDFHEIEHILTQEFSTLCKWFIANKLSIHFGEDKTSCVTFSKTKCSSKLNYTNHNIKQCHAVENTVGCHTDSKWGIYSNESSEKSQCKI